MAHRKAPNDFTRHDFVERSEDDEKLRNQAGLVVGGPSLMKSH
jgi:hypothetical protein